ncbi:exodeoxyribonuclease V subunit alpha [Acidithiobacillus ferrooxidans]|uniref:exodeoxyribonuclease V subunit alpha n=1 Tax=Acidithiobacillus ferrooxidans TaxID=920 RepID=UPI001C06CE01|nr:exodeoxyribonuclease V subunit alpha [Acidithiobacillus ferrooxidans]MBU2855528.1 exodeoxyribonuclease V subunit alpha [Acidithiobacillus ferrooxidans]MBU2859220.1 exodeoxyribonuclease V subunit alpha [Acidithiobacillus ferrooxidans]
MTSRMIDQLRAWTSAGWLRPLDLAFAQFLIRLDPQAPALLPLAGALLARLEGEGHTCIALEDFLGAPERFLDWPAPGHAMLATALGDWPHAAQWTETLARSRCVQVTERNAPVPANGAETPLVLSAARLYLRRYWRDQQFIAEALRQRAQQRVADAANPEASRPWLEQLFPASDEPGDALPWQKIACALALRSHFSIITGGPGTGKTYTAARFMALLMATSSTPLRIVLAAPTGKAAVRIDESLQSAVGTLPQLSQIPDMTAAFARLRPARTLHSLLGARPDSRRFRHDAANPLELDVLVVDEASMIHQEMMAALLRALPPAARLILLGDQDQLASVEAGAVLAELSLGSGKYDAETCHYMQASCGAAPQPGDNGPSPLAANIIRLQRSHRFNAEIGALADAVHGGHPETAVRILQTAHTGTLAWQPAPAIHRILELARPESAYGRVWQAAGQPPPKDRQQHSAWVKTILNDYAGFRILCALRQGPWGVTGINRAIEDYLQRQGILQSRGLWYAGRPTLVTRNDPNLGLSNGDIGIALPDPDKRLRVYFPNSEDAPRAILPSRLNHTESAWAMTVHKAQGSEFAHTVLILPPEDSPVLSRELLYTAITRARECFTLIAPRERLENAIQRQTRRMSGLHAALYDPRR